MIEWMINEEGAAYMHTLTRETKRAILAAHALQGVINREKTHVTPECIAAFAGECADATLAWLEKNPIHKK